MADQLRPQMPSDLFTLSPDRVDYAVLQEFVLVTEEANALTESLVVELKGAREGRNVVDAVAAMANSDGGVVLVGVAEDLRGPERFVGITQRDHDALVSQFRELLPADALPEIIAVTLPDRPGRVVLVLRVDADAVRHPVVVGGKVLIRYPGHTLPARREDVVALVRRDEKQTTPAGQSLAPIQPGHYPFWEQDDEPFLTVRVYGGLQLPPRVQKQPWLIPAAQDAAAASLRQCPLPDRLWTEHTRADEMTMARNDWRFVERTSTWLRLRCDGGTPMYPRWRPSARAGAFIGLSGRTLHFVVALGIDASRADNGASGDFVPLELDAIHEALLGGLVAQQVTCSGIADALGATAPAHSLGPQGWLQLPQGRRVSEAVNLARWSHEGSRDVPGHYFAADPLNSTGLDELARVAQRWVVLLLLDVGASGFEADLERVTRLPSWESRRQ